jgi:hypothetical protein
LPVSYSNIAWVNRGKSVKPFNYLGNTEMNINWL